jgi:hypothetical protein
MVPDLEEHKQGGDILLAFKEDGFDGTSKSS